MKISHLGFALLTACIVALHAQDIVSIQWPDLSHASKRDVRAFARDDAYRLWDSLKPQIIEHGLAAADDPLAKDATNCHLTGDLADLYVIAAEDAMTEQMNENAAVDQ